MVVDIEAGKARATARGNASPMDNHGGNERLAPKPEPREQALADAGKAGGEKAEAAHRTSGDGDERAQTKDDQPVGPCALASNQRRHPLPLLIRRVTH